uniref:AAA family ATPase n=1 Tax=Ndongobacter massiliensis TaxID=1871025 RepID=UPI000930C901|nr:MoxR family ATPase [Ndongobacter massiliensis]
MNKSSEVTDIFKKLSDRIRRSIAEVIVGKEKVTERMLITLFAGGHLLIEDIPGIGKTTLVYALAKALQLDFRRIQCTPDLMPSDITGFNLYNPKAGDFELQEGAVMTQILLGDEINRSTPRTQSALLEAMQEGQVTIDSVSYPLPSPFMVLATQNPTGHIGTYPLPEAQLDRFMMRISVGYPSFEEEMDIISLDASSTLQKPVTPAAEAKEVIWMQEQVRGVEVHDDVKKYALTLCRATRKQDQIALGASPRAAQMLLSASKARALLQGRDFVTPDDVQDLACDVLAHRLILTPAARAQGISVESILQTLLRETAAPR